MKITAAEIISYLRGLGVAPSWINLTQKFNLPTNAAKAIWREIAGAQWDDPQLSANIDAILKGMAIGESVQDAFRAALKFQEDGEEPEEGEDPEPKKEGEPEEPKEGEEPPKQEEEPTKEEPKAEAMAKGEIQSMANEAFEMAKRLAKAVGDEVPEVKKSMDQAYDMLKKAGEQLQTAAMRSK